MRSLLCLSSMLAIASATGAFAQANEPFVLGTIFLGSDATNEIGIDNEELTRTNPTDLQDVFASEPTISVGSSLPISQKIYVNGVEENQLNVTIDGARQNNRIFHHSATTYIDPSLLKAVRVDPGVAPADAGPAALAGAIAFETKDVDDLLDPGLSFGGRVSTEYTSNGDTLAGSLALYGRSGAFEYLAFGKLADGDLQEDGDGNEIVGSTTDLTSGLGKIAYTVQNGGRLEFSFERVEDDAQRPFRADFAGSNGSTDTRLYRLTRQNVVLSYTGGQTTEMWAPFFQLAFNSTDLDVGPGSFGVFGGESKSFTGKLQNDFTVSSGTVTAGLDFYVDSVDIQEVGGGGFFAEEKARNIGAFVQSRLELSDRARISTGFRYDFQTFEGVDGTKYDNNGLSANFAGDLRITENLTLIAGASRGWGGIALAESFIMDTNWDYPNSIDPVTSENTYYGLAANFGSLDLDWKVFRTRIDNARTPGGDPDTTSDLVSKGYELGARYNWQNGFIRIGYANIESEIDGNPANSFLGRYLTTPLGEQITLELGQTFDDRGLTLGVNAQIALEQTNVFDPFSGSPSSLPRYDVVNAFVEYTPPRSPNFTIRAEINNLFDEQYADRASYGQEFVEPFGLDPLFEPGRSVSVLASYRF